MPRTPLAAAFTGFAVAAGAAAALTALTNHGTGAALVTVTSPASQLTVAGFADAAARPVTTRLATAGSASDVWIDLGAGTGRRIRMMPGDVVSTPPNRPVRLTVHGSGTAWITLTEPTAQSRSCRTCQSDVGGAHDLARQLRLTVRDVTATGVATIVYDGPLAPATGQLAVRLPGHGTSGSWSSGESHSYQLTVAMPLTLGNGYQGTSAHVVFTYQQTAVLAERQTRLTPALPFTGADTGALALFGLAVVAGGTAIAVAARARNAPPDDSATRSGNR